jgi:hypothetical protein
VAALNAPAPPTSTGGAPITDRQAYIRKRHAEGASLNTILAELDKGQTTQKATTTTPGTTTMVKGPASANTIPGGVRDKQGRGLTPATPQNYTPIEPAPGTSVIPKGSSLKDTIRGINMKERMNATGPTNIASISPTINVGGSNAQPSEIRGAVTKAMAMSTAEMLTQLKAARSAEQRLGYT